MQLPLEGFGRRSKIHALSRLLVRVRFKFRVRVTVKFMIMIMVRISWSI